MFHGAQRCQTSWEQGSFKGRGLLQTPDPGGQLVTSSTERVFLPRASPAVCTRCHQVAPSAPRACARAPAAPAVRWLTGCALRYHCPVGVRNGRSENET